MQVKMPEPFRKLDENEGTSPRRRNCHTWMWLVLIFVSVVVILIICTNDGYVDGSLGDLWNVTFFNISIFSFPSWPSLSDFGVFTTVEVSDDTPTIDPSAVPKTTEEIHRDMERDFPSLPILFWDDYNRQFGNETLQPKFPNILELRFNNDYWQTVTAKNGLNFQLFSAFYDDRNESSPVVRLLGMIDQEMKDSDQMKMFCQLWYQNQSKPLISRIIDYHRIWTSNWSDPHTYRPYLLTCKIPIALDGFDGAPSVVSLVNGPQEAASNALKVVYNKPIEEPTTFGVCVRGLDFPNQDVSLRLIEWIELIRLLGANQIHFYKYDVHPNVAEVLKYYENQKAVHVTPYTLPGDQPNVPSLRNEYLQKNHLAKRQNDLIQFNDCLYKRMYEFNYLMMLNIDEVIVPGENVDNWSALIAKIGTAETDSFSAENVYFSNDLIDENDVDEVDPGFMYMMRHVSRWKHFTLPNRNDTYFVDTKRITSINDHFPLSCLDGDCKNLEINTSDAMVYHYNNDCLEDENGKCTFFKGELENDTTLSKYRQSLVLQVSTALEDLGYL